MRTQYWQNQTVWKLKTEIETLKEDKAILERRMLLGTDFLIHFLNKYTVLGHWLVLYRGCPVDELEEDLGMLCQKFGMTMTRKPTLHQGDYFTLEKQEE